MPEKADVFQMRLGLGLHRFGHGIEHIRRLVNPAALHPCLAANLVQGRPFGHSFGPVAVMPSPHGAVPDSQLGRDLQPPAFRFADLPDPLQFLRLWTH